MSEEKRFWVQYVHNGDTYKAPVGRLEPHGTYQKNSQDSGPIRFARRSTAEAFAKCIIEATEPVSGTFEVVEDPKPIHPEYARAEKEIAEYIKTSGWAASRALYEAITAGKHRGDR